MWRPAAERVPHESRPLLLSLFVPLPALLLPLNTKIFVLSAAATCRPAAACCCHELISWRGQHHLVPAPDGPHEVLLAGRDSG